MSQQCTNCAQLQGEVRRLQAENAMLRRIIQQAKSACATVINESRTTMSTHKPRGVWAYVKGSLESAQKILTRLNS